MISDITEFTKITDMRDKGGIADYRYHVGNEYAKIKHKIQYKKYCKS